MNTIIAKKNLLELWIRISTTLQVICKVGSTPNNIKTVSLSIFIGGFRKILLRSYVELPRQNQNDKMKQFWDNVSTGLASLVLLPYQA